jgi:hypothetical protein
LSVDLSVVIVNYNTADYLRACLPALETPTLSLEIIVVDNDGSAHDVVAGFPHVVYLPQPQNRWFCGGNNVGIDAAQGKYVLLLNPDTVVQPGALQAMVAFLDAHAEYLGVTTQMRYPDGSIQRTCSRVPSYAYLLVNHTLFGWIFRARKATLNDQHWYADWSRDTARDVEVLPGSCMMLRRGVRLDDDLLLYFPEDTLTRQHRGAKFHFLADHFITHYEKSVTTSWTATRVYFRDLLLYTRKQHGFAAWVLLALLSRPLLWGMALKRRLSSAHQH